MPSGQAITVFEPDHKQREQGFKDWSNSWHRRLTGRQNTPPLARAHAGKTVTTKSLDVPALPVIFRRQPYCMLDWYSPPIPTLVSPLSISLPLYNCRALKLSIPTYTSV